MWLRVGRLAGCALALAGVGCLAEGAWIRTKPYLANALIARAFVRHEHGELRARPWPWADTVPVARLTLPGGRGRELYVLEGASGRNLAFAPTHDSSSVLPGEVGNSVIAGHRDTAFRGLQLLKRGDGLRIERGRQTLWFEVTDLAVVDSTRTRIRLDAPTPLLTLVTCYPFNSLTYGGPLRYVVTAELRAAPPDLRAAPRKHLSP